MDDATRTEVEAAAYRRLRDHLMHERPDAQNIDLMNLAGFCRNCLSRWYAEEAQARGHPMTKAEGRVAVYGEPYEDWRDRHQTEASAEARDAFAAGHPATPES
ncbi:MAG: DUF1244 domain-containing protein [Paracoccaceae bacterium]